MEMVEIIIAGGLVLLAVPILVGIWKGKIMGVPRFLKEVCLRNKLVTTQYEFFFGKLLLLDTVHKKLLFIRPVKTGASEQLVALDKMTGCSLETIAAESPEGDVVTESRVRFDFHAEKERIELVIYDAGVDSTIQALAHEQIAREWVKRIEGCLMQESKA